MLTEVVLIHPPQ